MSTMGYEIHIKRPHQPDEKKSAIALAEWQRLVNEDPELQFAGFVEAHSPIGEVVRYENEGLALWTAHSGQQAVWFDYRNGKIVVARADAETMNKMRAVAAKLACFTTSSATPRRGATTSSCRRR